MCRFGRRERQSRNGQLGMEGSESEIGIENIDGFKVVYKLVGYKVKLVKILRRERKRERENNNIIIVDDGVIF